MILKFDKFLGKVKESLEKEEVIELVSLITDMKPSLQVEVDNSDISKLIDNINYYKSEDGKWLISVYFRESDIYKNKDGSVTRGDFKTLFKITISKLENEIKVGELKDFIITFYDIISSFYTNSVLKIKIEETKMTVEEFKSISDDKIIKDVKLIIRILD
jgi:hypothetical protein